MEKTDKTMTELKKSFIKTKLDKINREMSTKKTKLGEYVNREL